MTQEKFWFVDDEQQVRWAVRVSAGYSLRHGLPTTEPSIVFTSRDLQLQTAFTLDKDEQELTRYELLELLGLAKQEAAGQRARAA
jgi:hypothetical protein